MTVEEATFVLEEKVQQKRKYKDSRWKTHVQKHTDLSGPSTWKMD